MMSTAEIFEPRLSPIYKHSTSNIAMSSPKMSQIFYCHQEQWIQYFATARNIPDSMVSYVPSVNNLKVVIKNVMAASTTPKMPTSMPTITSKNNDDYDKIRYKNFVKAQIQNKMMAANKFGQLQQTATTKTK